MTGGAALPAAPPVSSLPEVVDAAMKTCPNCGNQVNEGAVGCPECGAKWSEDGAYLGLPDGAPVYVPVQQPKTVADMTPDQLGALIFHKAFWGAVLAFVTVGVVFWMLGAAIAGCAGAV
jgi:hypothetical protein